MFPERTGLRADRSQTGVPGNSTELLMSSLSVPSDFRPVNENLPPRLAPVRPKSRHTPEKIAVSCPPPSGFFRRGYWKVHFPSQADWTGGRLGDG